MDPPRLHRAMSTFARTLYRELRRADYAPKDVLRLVNEIVELVTADARQAGAEPPRPPPSLDRETGLPDAAVMREVLGFEVGHAQGGNDLLLVALDVELPIVTADAVVTAVQDREARLRAEHATPGRMATDGDSMPPSGNWRSTAAAADSSS